MTILTTAIHCLLLAGPPEVTTADGALTTMCQLRDDGMAVIDRTSLDDCEVYAVKVVGAQAGTASIEHPPRVVFAIDEVLLGPGVVGQQLAAVLPDATYVPPAVCHEPSEAPAPTKRAVPAVGSRFLIAGGWNATHSWFVAPAQGVRLPETSAALREAVRTLLASKIEMAARQKRMAAQTGKKDPLVR